MTLRDVGHTLLWTLAFHLEQHAVLGARKENNSSNLQHSFRHWKFYKHSICFPNEDLRTLRLGFFRCHLVIYHLYWLILEFTIAFRSRYSYCCLVQSILNDQNSFKLKSDHLFFSLALQFPSACRTKLPVLFWQTALSLHLLNDPHELLASGKVGINWARWVSHLMIAMAYDRSSRLNCGCNSRNICTVMWYE